MSYSGQEVLNHLLQYGMAAEAEGQLPAQLEAIAPLEEATSAQMSFVSHAKHLPKLAQSQAGLVLLKPEWRTQLPHDVPAILVDDPYAA